MIRNTEAVNIYVGRKWVPVPRFFSAADLCRHYQKANWGDHHTYRKESVCGAGNNLFHTMLVLPEPHNKMFFFIAAHLRHRVVCMDVLRVPSMVPSHVYFSFKSRARVFSLIFKPPTNFGRGSVRWNWVWTHGAKVSFIWGRTNHSSGGRLTTVVGGV
jgi:hypothetical protein